MSVLVHWLHGVRVTTGAQSPTPIRVSLRVEAFDLDRKRIRIWEAGGDAKQNQLVTQRDNPMVGTQTKKQKIKAEFCRVYHVIHARPAAIERSIS